MIYFNATRERLVAGCCGRHDRYFYFLGNILSTSPSFRLYQAERVTEPHMAELSSVLIALYTYQPLALSEYPATAACIAIFPLLALKCRAALLSDSAVIILGLGCLQASGKQRRTGRDAIDRTRATSLPDMPPPAGATTYHAIGQKLDL